MTGASPPDRCDSVDRASTVLPDVMAPDLDIVFCGTAAGAESARRGAYYAGPGNAFWLTLFAVGLTPVLVRPDEYATVREWRLGFTDLAKHVSGGDHFLAKAHFDVSRLHALILEHRPRILAFTGKRAATEFVGHAVSYGLLPERSGDTRLFVLPSPSGAARGHWNIEHWHELSRLRAAMACGWT